MRREWEGGPAEIEWLREEVRGLRDLDSVQAGIIAKQANDLDRLREENERLYAQLGDTVRDREIVRIENEQLRGLSRAVFETVWREVVPGSTGMTLATWDGNLRLRLEIKPVEDRLFWRLVRDHSPTSDQ